jgi:saccharopine dehydrogenase (NAD+, L-lysine forming)
VASVTPLRGSRRGGDSSSSWSSPTTTGLGLSGLLQRCSSDTQTKTASSPAQVDASDADSVAALVRDHQGTHVMNAVDPRFVMPIFQGAYAAGVDYLDMAMSLSQRHPESPYELTWVKLGDEQFAQADEWEQTGRLALVGMGVEPGLSDVFARYAADHTVLRDR